MFNRSVPTEEGLQRLRTQLGSLRAGCAADFLTPLLARGSGDDGRAACAAEVWEACKLSSCESRLVEVERVQRLKHGTYSKTPGYFTIPPGGSSMESGVLRYFTPRKTSLELRSMEFADRAVKRLLGKGSLSIASLFDAAVSFSKRAACGWPFFSSAAVTPYEYYHEAKLIERDCYHVSHARSYPGVLGLRSQPRGPGSCAKARVVFGCSRVHNVIKKRVFIPAFSALSRLDMFPAWLSRHAVDVGVTRVLSRRRRVLSVDFSNFDASVPPEVIDRQFDALVYWFDAPSTPVIRFCQEAFHRTGIFVPDGYHHGDERTGGVPSGSVFTNLVDSLVNYWLMHYAAHRNGGVVIDALVQGDDGVYVFDGITDPSLLSATLLEDFGMVMSPEKCHWAAGEVHFLQMYHSTSYARNGLYVGVRPLMRVLNGMMSYEKGRRTGWLPIMDSLRWLQQLDNASAHPSFECMCSWLLQHDRYLPEAVHCIINNDPVLSQASEVLGYGDDCKVKVSELYRSPVVRHIQGLL